MHNNNLKILLLLIAEFIGIFFVLYIYVFWQSSIYTSIPQNGQSLWILTDLLSFFSPFLWNITWLGLLSLTGVCITYFFITHKIKIWLSVIMGLLYCLHPSILKLADLNKESIIIVICLPIIISLWQPLLKKIFQNKIIKIISAILIFLVIIILYKLCPPTSSLSFLQEIKANSISLIDLFVPYHWFKQLSVSYYLGIPLILLFLSTFLNKNKNQQSIKYSYGAVIALMLSFGPFIIFSNLDKIIPLPQIIMSLVLPKMFIFSTPKLFFAPALLLIMISIVFIFEKNKLFNKLAPLLLAITIVAIPPTLSTTNDSFIDANLPENQTSSSYLLDLSDSSAIEKYFTAKKQWSLFKINNKIIINDIVQGGFSGIIIHPYKKQLLPALSSYNIKAITVNSGTDSETFLNTNLPITTNKKNSLSNSLYLLPQTSDSSWSYIIIPDKNWSNLKTTKNNNNYKWINNKTANIEINIFNKPQTLKIIITANSITPQNVSFYINNEYLKTQNISAEKNIIEIELPELSPGIHYLSLKNIQDKIKVFSIAY